MPTIDENKNQWNDHYDWPANGEEWSESWGSASSQWHGTILPRIAPCLPTEFMVEIGAGHGRWTEFLKDYCANLLSLDVSPRCIDYCKLRFSKEHNVAFAVNDGSTLDVVTNDSVGFIFSFDSLVHAEFDVIDSYVSEVARVLRPGGFAFIHHSNLGEYHNECLLTTDVRNYDHPFRARLREHGLILNPGWRGRDVTAKRVEQSCDRVGLSCISQELVNWKNPRCLIDCFSLLKKQDKAGARIRNTLIQNDLFMHEAARIKALYASGPKADNSTGD